MLEAWPFSSPMAKIQFRSYVSFTERYVVRIGYVCYVQVRWLFTAKTTFLIRQVNPSHARGKFLPELHVAIQ